MDAKQLRETATRLSEKRTQFMLLCQEIAENFYPERADFTLRRSTMRRSLSIISISTRRARKRI